MPTSPQAQTEENLIAFRRGRDRQESRQPAGKKIPSDAKPSESELADDLRAVAENETFEGGDYDRVEEERKWQVLRLRGVWSNWLIAWITFLLVGQAGLAIGIGFGWMSFDRHPYFLGFLVGQSFLQIVGMGALIVKFLYPARTTGS